MRRAGITKAAASALIPAFIFAHGCAPKSVRKQPMAAQAKFVQQTTEPGPKAGLNLSAALSRANKMYAETPYFKPKNKTVNKKKNREEQMLGDLPEIRKRILKELEMERIERERRNSRK